MQRISQIKHSRILETDRYVREPTISETYAGHEEGPLSNWETTLATSTAAHEPRPMSRDQSHGLEDSLKLNDLEYEFDVTSNSYPLQGVSSLLDLFSGIQYHQVWKKEENFSPVSQLECLKLNENGAGT